LTFALVFCIAECCTTQCTSGGTYGGTLQAATALIADDSSGPSSEKCTEHSTLLGAGSTGA
jgi:hypothetical protein